MQAIVQKVIENMGHLSKPQIKVMNPLVMTILVLCGKVNFTNLSRYSSLNEKTYRRFFAKAFNFYRVNPLLTQTDYALIQLETTRPYVAERVRYLAVDAAYANEPFVSEFRRDILPLFFFRFNNASNRFADPLNMRDSDGARMVLR